MRKINKLTPEQLVDVPVFRQKYLDMAQGASPDRAILTEVMAKTYALVDQPPPQVLILQSPRMAMLAASFFKNISNRDQIRDQLGGQLRDQIRGQLWGQIRGQLGGQLGGQLWDQLGGQLGDQLRDQLGGQLRDQLGGQLRDQLGGQLGGQLRDQIRGQLWGQLWDQIRGQLGGQLWDQLGGQLGDQLGGQLRDQLGGQLWDQLRDQLGGQLWNSDYMWGSQDLYWICWARFALRIGVKLEKETHQQLDMMEAISTPCEWWWPMEGLVVVSAKPTVIHWDEDGRLHRENGPAVKYADGFSLYSWRGTAVPEPWVTGSPPTAADALVQENVELRRVACEIVGWDEILNQLNAKIIDEDVDPQIGTLVEVNLPEAGPERFLRVVCGTGRKFALPVPPETATALAANAWLNHCDKPGDYMPEIRT